MYRQIADELRESIRSGALKEGDPLPSEAALVAQHGTSQGTVRKAMSILRSEGWVVAESGRGVFVRRRPVVFRKGNERFARANRVGDHGRAAFDVEVASHGLRSRTETEVEGPADPPDDVAAWLGLDDGQQVAVRRRRMYADGDLVQLADSFIPWDIADGTQIVETNSGPGGIYARIEERGHELAEFDEQIRVRPALPEEVSALGIESGMPVILLTRVAYDTTGRAVEVCDCVMTADRWCLNYRFPAT
jgi:GntR family transcriptional regulator